MIDFWSLDEIAVIGAITIIGAVVCLLIVLMQMGKLEGLKSFLFSVVPLIYFTSCLVFFSK